MSALIEFLKSLGITRGNKPETCPYCGARWPYCKWNSIRDESPCSSSSEVVCAKLG